MIDDYVVFVGAAVVIVVVFVVDVAATEFDVVVSAAVAVAVFHLFVLGLVLFAVAVLFVSDFEIDNGDSALVWDFFGIFADYFGDLDDVAESAVCRLYLGVHVDLAIFL